MSESREGWKGARSGPSTEWQRTVARGARKLGDGVLRGIGYSAGTTSFGLLLIWWQNHH
jgi:hypothetical protein